MRALLAAAAVAAPIVLAGPAAAEPMPTKTFTSCKQLRAEYSAGIAKNAKAARKAVKKGYRKPLVCKRVYLQVTPALDPNRNGVACEVR
ncbi:MAG: excalibur calcium-binding domain-containing protein [Actinobacteria bacterium]|nr:excalibur calcium-binding domain-containing protein [Actinomycetota bacterium]MCB8995922.1 excalibur calcium-binding domain-containing protein [Actinomycetota bacterium]